MLTWATSARIAFTSSVNSPAAMPCAAGPMTSAGRMVPVTLPPTPAGQACVPAGPFPRLEHRKTEMPPLTSSWPTWMWACCAGPLSRSSVSTYLISGADRLIAATKVPPPLVEKAGTSS